jgi:flagellar biosynthesis protein FlhA
VFNVAGELEGMLLASLSQAQQTGKVSLDNFAIAPNLLTQLQSNMPAIAEQMKIRGSTPVLLVPPQLRPLLARYARVFSPALHVLSYNEIPEHHTLDVMGTLG